MRPSSTLVLALTFAACSASERERGSTTTATEQQAPTPKQPAPKAPTHEFGPLIGGRLPLAVPSPGRYASSLRVRQHRFVTMEMTISSSIDGGASLDLRADGSAHGCFWASTVDSGSISHYASHDGLDHHNVSKYETRIGARGTWVADPKTARAKVQFSVIQHDACEPREDAVELPTAWEMRCHAIAANEQLPVPALVCRPSEHLGREVALALEPNPRSGPWMTREDPTGRYPPAFGEDVRPWLLLGTPGLSIETVDEQEGEPPKVTLTVGEVPNPEGVLVREPDR